MMIGSRLRALSLGLVAGATLATSPGPFGPGTALAESALLLPYPTSYKVFPASTYDKKGKRLGAAELSLERLDGGGVRIGIQCGAESGARTVAHAELGPAAGGSGLRLLREQSQSYDERGRPLVLLRIDHANGKATCTPPPGAKGDRIEVDLPSGERIANVPLNLLFLPLVEGEVDELEFQYFLCRGGAKVVNFRARLAHSTAGRNGRRVIEVHYGPDLNQFVSWLARALTPDLAFWFEVGDETHYLAHRMPLYSKGPEVMIVRDDFSLASLGVLR
ncbi:MAG: hypothetical protein V3T33_03350 [Myxococcota bacterium]